METDEIRAVLEAEKTRIENAKENLANNKASIEDQKLLKAHYLAQAEAIQDGQKMANDLYDAFSELMDILGGGDSVGATFAQMGMDMANSVMNCFALQLQLQSATVEAHTFGAAMNTAMGIVGWIVMGVQLIGQALGAIFASGDKAKERKIQRELKHVAELEKRYKQIEEALDDMYSTQQMSAYSKELSSNIDEQIESYERMIQLEQDKKKTDTDKIEGHYDKIEELTKQREEMYKEMASQATAGILDNALSAAEGFVDAWYEAFKETGDGLSGLEGEFTEMLTNLVKRQAAMQIVGPYIEKYSEWLKEYINPEKGDMTLTAEDAKAWADRIRETLPGMSESLEALWSGMQGLIGSDDGLSDLSKGIQGITETTAQALEALLNSMRFYVADSNIRLKNIEAAFANSDISKNPLLNELRQQTAIIKSIEEMFGSVIGRGSGSHSGAYLKVLV